MESKAGYIAKQNVLQKGFLINLLYQFQAFPTFKNAFNRSQLTNFTIGAKGGALCKTQVRLLSCILLRYVPSLS